MTVTTSAIPRYRFTDRADGDLAPSSVGVDRRRAQVVDLPWTWLRQVHGADVVVVDEHAGQAGATADAAVTAVPGAAISVQVADCAPVALIGDRVVGVAHAGWRGLVAGIVPAVVASMQRLAPGPLRAVIGPCIRPRCYPFGAPDLDVVAGAVGDVVRSEAAGGRPALDLAAGVRAALAAAGVDHCDDVNVCTACSPGHWSHRGNGDRQRQSLVAWVGP